ncbi:tetratricopeptide repeat protein [Geobacter sp. OR-1]|uniref:tetratricopeptide repeat protein n=1 Tax=Geobacter sp. OR-1 TaxID=1266765 RepID=UPI000543D3A7|nr:tetratricopeptide repeat protein [Geobacter sp. OR-1]GAM09367.1 tetratricopeptide repeat protein [Geobacter sp. OR-1]
MRRLYLAILILTAIGIAMVRPSSCFGEESLLEQGVREYRDENFEEAMVTLKAARGKEPGSSVAAFYLGLTFKQTGEYSAAAEQFRDAFRLTPPILDAPLELAETLFTMGDVAGAKKALIDAEKNRVRPAAVSFLKGVVLAKENEIDDAIDCFRTAAKLDPSLAQPAELQIAILQARERRISQARKSLRTLIAMDPASDAASMAKEYETTFTRLIEAHRSWRLTAGANYLYDDNVISNPDNDTRLDQLDRDSAFVGTFRIDYAPLIDPPWGIIAQYNFQSTTYGTLYTMNTLVNSVSIVPSYTQRNGAASLPVSYSHVLLADKKYMGIASVRPTQSLLLPFSHIVQLNLAYTRREMLRDPLLFDEDRDADIFGAGAAYVVPFAEGNGMASLRYEFSYDNAIGQNWVNRGHRVNIGANFPVVDGLSIQVNGDLFDQDYLHRHTTFGKVREDTIYTAIAGLTWDISANISLNFQYNHTRSVSNIDQYDYRRNTVIAGLEASF